MLNKVFLNKFFKCGISILKNYKLIKMDILICSVVLFGYLVLFFFFYVKQIYGVVMYEWRFWFFFVEVVFKDGVVYWWQIYCVCVWGLDVYVFVQFYQGDIVGVVFVEGCVLVVFLFFFFVISYVQGMLGKIKIINYNNMKIVIRVICK